MLERLAFVIGSGRSGTTLLRVMLAGHPRLFGPPEMVIAPFETMAERTAYMQKRWWEKGGLRRAVLELESISVDEAKARVAAMDDWSVEQVYEWLQQQIGDRMLVDKCPHLSYLPGTLVRSQGFARDVRYVWIVRHPGSVIRSFENMPMAEVMLQTADLRDAEDAWLRSNTNLRDFFADLPEDRWTMVRYEDLVSEPRREMERICRTLGVAFDEAVLEPYQGQRMREGPKGARAIGDPNMAARGKIDPALATKWLEGFDPHAVSAQTRELAAELGYDLDALERPPIVAVSQALDELWDSAKRIEHAMKVPQDVDAVEGRRFLLRMLAASTDTFVEWTDADRPAFHHSEGPHRKMFGDCPDTDYLRAPIRLGDGRTYRVSGRIPPGTAYAGLLLYGRKGRVSHGLADSELKLDEDGRFAVTLTADGDADEDTVVLRGDGDENAVMFRQYYCDRSAEPPAELSIELCGETPQPEQLDPRWLAKRVQLARRMLEAIVSRTDQARQMAIATALNRFVTIPADQLFPTPDNTYQVCWYRFGPDMRVMVRGKLPRARYFSFTLYNGWMESLDYTRRRVHLNHTQIAADGDGRFELCLAPRDPGHPNWLDIAGHQAGYLVARSLLLEGDAPELEVEVVH